MKKYLIRAAASLLTVSLLVSLMLPFATAAPDVEVQAESSAASASSVPPITIEARAALLMDPESDQILYEQDAHKKCYPASITKIMTALLVLEAVGREEVSLSAEVTVPEEAFSDMDEESSTAGLQPGEVITVEGLLYCLMVASANEAANTLAITMCGDVKPFVERMNQRAQELGMEDTHFVNPHGLHDADHYSTAYDIYLMAKEAMTHAIFREIVSTKQYTLPATNASGERILSNTNGLLTGYHYPGYSMKGTIGIKTGSTGPAGYCLCAAVTQNGHTLISVVLGADNPETPHGKDDVTRMQFVESGRLQQWGFDNFSYVTLLDADSVKKDVAVNSSFQDNHVILRPEHSVQVLIPGEYNEELLDLKLELKNDPISEAVSEGEAMGTMTVSYGGEVYDTVDMVAVNAVSYSPFLAFVNNVNAVLSNLFVRIVLLIALVLLLVGLGRRLYAAKQEELARLNAKRRRAQQAWRDRRAQERAAREAVRGQRQVEYEARKKEERQIRAQRAQEREKQREEERLRRREEQRQRQEEARLRRQEEQRRKELERRQRQEEAMRRRTERNRPRPDAWDDSYDQRSRRFRESDFDDSRGRRGNDYDDSRNRWGSDYNDSRSRWGSDYDNSRSRRGNDYDNSRSRRGNDYDNSRGRWGNDYDNSRGRWGNDYDNSRGRRDVREDHRSRNDPSPKRGGRQNRRNDGPPSRRR